MTPIAKHKADEIGEQSVGCPTPMPDNVKCVQEDSMQGEGYASSKSSSKRPAGGWIVIVP